MELSLFPYHQNSLTLTYKPLFSVPLPAKRLPRRNSFLLPCRCKLTSDDDASKQANISLQHEGRRVLVGSLLTAAAAMYVCDVAEAVSTSRRALRGAKIPESEFTVLPNGLKYYDLKVGSGLKAVKGSRVAVRLVTKISAILLGNQRVLSPPCSVRRKMKKLLVCTCKSSPFMIHYVAKWRGITFMTSRQGLGVGGGTPYGFDIGQSERGNVLKGLDIGVEGMRVGGQRLLIVPPELAYGKKGVQEIPPNATIELDVELLAIKQSPFGTPVKVIEG